MSEAQPSSLTNRRNVIRSAALMGLAGTITFAGTQVQATENNTVFPDDFSYPDITGPSLTLWGSSSFEGYRATEGVPSGFDARISTLLSQYVNQPVLNFGRGGETSTTISARRGVQKYIYAPVFPNDTLPASGAVEVSLESGNQIGWDESTYTPGFVQDIPVTLKATTLGKYTLTRLADGKPRYAPKGTGANFMYSYQEMLARSSRHILQVGRNNINQIDQIQADTKACFDLAPHRSIVVGHYAKQDDAKDSKAYKNFTTYNDWARSTYGDLFVDTVYWLREVSQQSWLRYGDLAGSGVWNSDDDRKDYDEGKIPRSFYASDGLHLNGWGYIVVARAIEERVRAIGWV